MLTRLQDLVRRTRKRRTRDEQGSAMMLVITVVLVGFMISAGISAASMASVKQTTSGRSQVQALAAAEAGRDVMAAGLTPSTTQTCPTPNASGVYSGISGSSSWTAELYYRLAPTPSGTAFASDGSPLPAGTWTKTTCAELGGLSVPTGLLQENYVVAVAAKGVAADGTQRVVSAVFPFTVKLPDKSIMAPLTGPYTLQGALGGNVGQVAHSGDLVIKKRSGAAGPTFVCGRGSEITVIDGDVYVLDGDAEFRWPGCFITGDLYVAGNILVSGDLTDADSGVLPAQPAFEKAIFPSNPKKFGYGDDGLAQGRLLWVGGEVKVRGNLTEQGGMTVRRSITAGGNVRLKCGTSKGLDEANVGADLAANRTAIHAGGTVSLIENGLGCGATSELINGAVKAVETVTTSGNRGLTTGQAAWKISGPVEAGGAISLGGTEARNITSPVNVTLENRSATAAVVAGGTATVNESSAGPVTANGAVTVSNTGAFGQSVGGIISGAAISIGRTGGFSGDLTVDGNIRTRAGDVSVMRDGTGGGDLTLAGSLATGGGGVIITRSGSDAGSLTMTGDVSANGAVSITRTGGFTAGTLLKLTGNVRAHGNVEIARTGAGLGNLELTGQVSTDFGSITIRRDGSNWGNLLMTGDVAANGPVTITRSDGVGALRVDGAVRASGDVKLERRDQGSLVGNGATLRVKSVQTTGNVEQRDAEVDECVVANGTFVGMPTSDFYGVKIGKCLQVRGAATISAGLDGVGKEARVGDGAASPTTIWSGTRVDLLSLGGTGWVDYGNVDGNVYAPVITKDNVWKISGSQVTTNTGQPPLVATPTIPSPVAVAGAAPVTVTGTPPVSVNGTTLPVAPDPNDLATTTDGTTVLDGGHWMDLGYDQVRDLAMQSGYTETSFDGQSLTFSGADCKKGGFLGLGWSPATQLMARALASDGKKYLIDATACEDPIRWEFDVALSIKSDAVVLVKNFRNQLTSGWLGSTTGTAASPRNLFFIQPDSQPDRRPTCNNSVDASPVDRPQNTRPDEQTGRNDFDLGSSYGKTEVSTMYYMPCGMGGTVTPSTASNRIYGQMFVGQQSSSIWTQFHCQPMKLGVPAVLNFTCGTPMSADDVAGGGGIKTHTLGASILQTEPS